MKIVVEVIDSAFSTLNSIDTSSNPALELIVNIVKTFLEELRTSVEVALGSLSSQCQVSMFIADGNVNSGSSSSVEVWTPYDGPHCSMDPGMPEPRIHGTMNGFVYCGGNLATTDPNTCLVYNPTTNNWTKHEYGGGKRWYHTSAKIGDVIYLIGAEVGSASKTTEKIWFDINGDFQSEAGFSLGDQSIM